MSLNLDMALLDGLIERIEKHPDAHDQGTWFSSPDGKLYEDDIYDFGVRYLPVADMFRDADLSCGTTACTAGHILTMRAPAGATFALGGFIKFANGGNDHISSWAARQLGINWDQANCLFYKLSTTDGVLRALRWLKAHPTASPESLWAEAGEFDSQEYEDQ